MYRYNSLYIQLHCISINIEIRSDIRLSKNNYLLHFLRISHFDICFDSKLYGYLDFFKRIKFELNLTDNLPIPTYKIRELALKEMNP